MARPRSADPGDAAWRRRTREAFPLGGMCRGCGRKKAAIRHHRDGNVRNLSPANVELLCRACHVERDPKIIPH